MADNKPLSKSEYLRAMWKVARLSYSLAPGAVFLKLFGAVLTAALPLVTTYFAAQTTTELANAFAGNPASGQKAIMFVIATTVTGLVTMIWSSIDSYIQQLMRYKIETKVSDVMYEKFHRLEYWRYDDKNTVDMYDKAQRFSQFFAFVFDRIASILSLFITVVSAIIALFLVVPFIAAIVFVAVIPGVYLQFRLSRLQMQNWKKNVGTRRSRSFIEWNLLQPNAAGELRLNGLIRYLLDLRQTLRDKDERAQLVFERQFIFKRLGADGLQAFAELGSILWVTLEIIAHRQPLGQFVYVQQIVSRVMSSAGSLVTEIRTIDEDIANLGDYQKFMELEEATGGTHQLLMAPHQIRFDHVSFR